MKQYFEITRVKMTTDDTQKLLSAIDHGTRPAAQKMYEFNQPVYDEDAGVFTDYGQNDPARTFAQVHFVELCNNAILNVEWDNCTEDGPTHAYITILNMAIPAVHQLLWCLYSDLAFQDTMLETRIRGEWESDGHYGSKSREEFEKDLKHMWRLDPAQGRRIGDQLQDGGRNAQHFYGKLIINGGK
jgi:hypothetical protein